MIAVDWHQVLPFALVAAVAITGLAVWGLRRKKAAAVRSKEKFEAAVSLGYHDYVEAGSKALEKLSKNWRVVEIVHDISQYTLGPAGLPEEVTLEDAFDVVRKIRAADGQALAVVIHTMGGYSMPTEMIAKALSRHKGEKVAFVPYAAMSGGTVIALSTQEIVMGPEASLGPIDTQYGGFPASAYEYLKSHKSLDAIHDHLVMLFPLVERFEKEAIQGARALLDSHHKPGVIDELMVSGRHHGEAIYPQDARDMGIRVSTKPCPDAVFELVDARIRLASLTRKKLYAEALGIDQAGTSPDWRTGHAALARWPGAVGWNQGIRL